MDWKYSEGTSDIFYSDGAKELSLNPVFCILLQKNWEILIENMKIKGNLVRDNKLRVQSSKNSKIRTTKWTWINSEDWQERFHVETICKGKRSEEELAIEKWDSAKSEPFIDFKHKNKVETASHT